jgi:RNA polymerase sigma-70 factor (ECF subfamily)
VSAPTRTWVDFDDFFRDNLAALRAFVIKNGFSYEEAADAAQEAMVGACRAWGYISAPRAWVYRVAIRSAVRTVARQNDGVRRAVAGGWATSREQVAADQLAAVDEQPLVEVLLARLPERQRAVIAWHLEGFDIAEIAEGLEMKPATVRSTLRHARQRLQRERGTGEPAGGAPGGA